MFGNDYSRQEWSSGGYGGGDFRPDLPSYGDDGGSKYPTVCGNGGVGAPEHEDRKSEAVPYF